VQNPPNAAAVRLRDSQLAHADSALAAARESCGLLRMPA